MTATRWRWLLFGAAILGLGVVAALAVADGDDEPAITTTTTRPGPLQEAVLRAAVNVTGVSQDDVAELIEEVCHARDGSSLGELVAALGVSAEVDVRTVIEGVGRGAARLCPEVPAQQPDLLNEAYEAAIAATGG
jgi:hypothetical protein